MTSNWFEIEGVPNLELFSYLIDGKRQDALFLNGKLLADEEIDAMSEDGPCSPDCPYCNEAE